MKREILDENIEETTIGLFLRTCSGLLEKRCGGVTIPTAFKLSESREGRRHLRHEQDLEQKNSEYTFRPETNESRRQDRLHAVMGGSSGSFMNTSLDMGMGLSGKGSIWSSCFHFPWFGYMVTVGWDHIMLTSYNADIILRFFVSFFIRSYSYLYHHSSFYFILRTFQNKTLVNLQNRISRNPVTIRHVA